ncbi:MAG: hypothetical protein JNK78_10095 [Planctomycetes bacterium]|nr:hypothetical protein [Planctomycetota bacterium]
MNLLHASPLLLAFSATLPAQTFDLRSAHTVVRTGDGAVLAIGRDYKATFAADGATFAPALGPRAAVRGELTLRVARIGRDNRVAWQADTAPTAAAALRDHVVTFARGVCTETYECRVDGVEQSFVFDRRPDGTGDLVVRCDVTTALEPTVRGDGTLFFHDGAIGGVTVGAITGVDAIGRTCPGSLQRHDGAIELRLPAAFVDSAAYPLTLDPLLATGFLIGSATDNEDQVDAAYGASPNTTLVVWRRSYSQWNQDVYGQQVANDGSLSGPLLVISSGAHAERSPSVTYVRGRNRHVVCWLQASSMVGPWTVEARTVNGATLGSTVTVSGNTAPNGRWITSAGDSSALGTSTLVVWATALGTSPFGEQTTILRTNTIDISAFGTVSVGTPADLTSSLAFPTDDVFALPKSRTPGGVTALAAHVPGQTGQHRVHALDHLGNYLAASVHVSTTDPAKEPALAIDGNGTDFVVACRRFDGETVVRQITWNGTAFTSGTNVTVLGTPQSSACAVGFLGERFLVAWSEGTANPFDNDLRGVAIKPNCEVCSQSFTLASVARPNARGPAIAPVVAGGGSTNTALLAWDETNTSSPFTGSVVGRFFAAMVGAPPVFLSPGCGNGGTASATGPFSPGNDQFAFALSGGDPTAPFALISLSLGGSSVLCGCELTNFLVLEATLAQAGSSTYAFKPWCDPSYLGTDIEFQWLLWPAAQSPCPIVENLAASNRMLVTLQP